MPQSASPEVGESRRLISVESSVGRHESSGSPNLSADLRPVSGVLRAQRLLYCSHAISTWGQRMWEFAVGLVLLELHPESLQWVAAFGLVDGLASVVCGAWVGSFLDRQPRYRGASLMYVLQNASVGLSAGSCLIALFMPHVPAVFWASSIFTVAAASVSTLGALGSTIAVEKDWVRALHANDPYALSCANAGMRRIDLTCLIASPIAAGFLMTYGGAVAAVLAIVGWNLIAWLPEVLLLARAQYHAPSLSERAVDAQRNTLKKVPGSPFGLYGAWWTYWRQSVMLAASALSMLYLTVLSLGLLMTAYLKWRGMTEAKLSLFRGIGAAAGVASTWTFPWAQDRIGLDLTGLTGIYWQLVCLLAAVTPAVWDRFIFSLGNATITYSLVLGLAASRFGLWTFDLTVSQMLQTRVAEEDIGVVNGVQGSLQSFCGSLSYVICLFVWQPANFDWLMTASCVSVLAASIMYTFQFSQVRSL